MAERIVQVKRWYAVEYAIPVAEYGDYTEDQIIAVEKFPTDAFTLADLDQVDVEVQIVTVGQ